MSDDSCRPGGLPFDKDGNPRIRWVRISFEGSWCVCRPADEPDMTAGMEPSEFSTEDVMLSEQEVAAMPEFEGW